MADSTVVDWLNENEQRSYPFEEGASRVSTEGYTLPDDFLVDLQLSTAESFTGRIRLLSVDATVAGSVTLIFGTDTLELSYAVETSGIFPLYHRANDGSLIVFGAGLAAVETLSQLHEFDALYVEPALVTDFSHLWRGVTSISAALDYQTRVLPADNPQLVRTPLVAQSTPVKLTGEVQMLEGFNFYTWLDEATNSVNLQVTSDGRHRLSCDMEFIETARKDCSEIISYINGVAPNNAGQLQLLGQTNINIVDGQNLTTFYDPLDIARGNNSLPQEKANSHSLFMGLTFLQDDLCEPIHLTPTL